VNEEQQDDKLKKENITYIKNFIEKDLEKRLSHNLKQKLKKSKGIKESLELKKNKDLESL